MLSGCIRLALILFLQGRIAMTEEFSASSPTELISLKLPLTHASCPSTVVSAPIEIVWWVHSEVDPSVSVVGTICPIVVWSLSSSSVANPAIIPSRYIARCSVNGYVALIADEASRSRVKDHYPKELQVAIGVTLKSVRKETGRRLRVY